MSIKKYPFAKTPSPPTLQDLHSLGGTQDGHLFFITPSWIDKSKEPGHTPFPIPTFQEFVWNGIFQKHLFFSPNLIWLIITIAIYFLFPYDLTSANAAAKIAPVSKEFFVERFPMWFCVVFGYFAFWHITLHILQWGDRPFVANRPYRISKTIHNGFYTIVGIIVAVLTENIFCFLYATGRLEYYSDSEILSLSSPLLHIMTYFWVSIIPLWRDFHFYFAHRLIHYDALYRYIHSLHHRNTDIEPFAGLSMHPVEHIMYYASYGPLLLCKVSPFIMLWNLAHLVLAPAASHSGEESAWQSDSFHYLHHRFFTYNYAGLGASFLDVTFGSFLPQWPEKLENNSSGKPAKKIDIVNDENNNNNDNDNIHGTISNFYTEEFLSQHDAKATLWGFPSLDVALYNFLALGTVILGLAGACDYKNIKSIWFREKVLSSKLLSSVSIALNIQDISIYEKIFFAWFLCGFGSVWVAYLLNYFFHGNTSPRNAKREKTAQDNSKMHFWIHLICGLLCCPIPVSYLVSLCF